jgi:sulfite exporter TauE/SafE
MTAFLTGLALGFASSAHCTAMCGPLVLATARIQGARSRVRRAQYAVLHHLARTATYALLAVPAGLAGHALALHGFGRAIAIAAGVALLGAAAGSLRLRGFTGVAALMSLFVTRVSTPALRLARARPRAGAIAIGVLNGVLPCGLVYAALAAASANESVTSAMLLMTGFGAGTSGVLIVMSLGAASIPAPLGVRLRPVAPVLLAIVAALLIARGVTTPSAHAAASMPVEHRTVIP